MTRFCGRALCDRGRMSRMVSSRRARRSLLSGAILALAALSGAPDPMAVAVTPRWDWPLEAPHFVVRPFIAPETPYSSGHRGIDIGGGEGVPVRAPASGVVHFSGWVVDRPVVSLRHSGGLVSSFEPVAGVLVEGDSVTAGDVIGVLASGHCASPCLHFGVRRFGEYVSPLLFLGGIPRSVLLPTRQVP